MSGNIRAIETVYNGYKFRSRLEAKWAVFFDAVGIKYQYEIEGYEMDDIRYLPDFYLPEYDRWFEIKGKPMSIAEIKKCEEFCFRKDNENIFASINRLKTLLATSQIDNIAGGKTIVTADTIHFSNKIANAQALIKQSKDLITPVPVNYKNACLSGWVE